MLCRAHLNRVQENQVVTSTRAVRSSPSGAKPARTGGGARARGMARWMRVPTATGPLWRRRCCGCRRRAYSGRSWVTFEAGETSGREPIIAPRHSRLPGKNRDTPPPAATSPASGSNSLVTHARASLQQPQTPHFPTVRQQQPSTPTTHATKTAKKTTLSPHKEPSLTY